METLWWAFPTGPGLVQTLQQGCLGWPKNQRYDIVIV